MWRLLARVVGSSRGQVAMEGTDMSPPWPDYGTPGNPNLDPYYISPEQERELEAEYYATRDNLREQLLAVLADERDGLWKSEVIYIVRDILLEMKPAAGEPAWQGEKLNAQLRELKL
jgi:hypothetical protein